MNSMESQDGGLAHDAVGTEVTQSPSLNPSTPSPEPTVVMTAQPQSVIGGHDPLADAEGRRKMELDLSRLGVSREEIQRLMNASSNTASVPPKSALTTSIPSLGASIPSAKPAKPKRPSVDDLHSFAAQLMQQQSAANVQKIAEISLDLPEFRESTGDEVRRGEVLLREAQMLRKREHYPEAESKCREALNLIPKDAAALEFLGDLLQGLARIDEALAVYKRAIEANPKRYSAEKKYGDLLVRQQNWSAADDSIPRNGFAAVLLSTLLPGAGQLHNGDIGKGVFFIITFLINVFLVGWSPWGLKSEHVKHGLNTSFLTCAIVMGVFYIAAMIDANTGAKNTHR